ncbi:xanthine dehydrogenase family protein molybdopterin-binding subunit [Celeribacter indicus]|uniref:Xanthine dehydrogenase YagR molybdenum-binding subunit n=1 Tax=Celeribacter indicus TaxID=1208324 RepID=A0A0B5E969_9RHOB|nr:xanthine dehydrogenase family protein molybdopterin-binding subunit [Celeribacter indicus]AJE48872.1 xanthine dehydrogenase YagR molybdenum-binding subunit [Celeribacter indicus]SDW39818.1 xanthine dehydrogenase, molybdenum binding subunit apoprotein [Celeribacter indicus]
MSYDFKMDDPQPRLLDETRQGAIGKPIDRVDGPAKVTGRATYVADVLPARTAHGVLVRATISRGRITGIDEAPLSGLEGVLGVFHGPKFIRNPAQGMAGKAPVQTDMRVDYHGQPIALVVAESLETARDAAFRLHISYEAEEAEVDPEAASAVDVDEPVRRGNFQLCWDKADVTVDAVLTTPGHAAAAMEPHGALASWEGDELTLRGSLQMLAYNRAEIADSLGIDPEKVRVLAPFIGGAFGSKLGIGPDAVAAAVAARELGRPVRVVMARQTVFDAVLRRSETIQHLRLAADGDGRLLALGHDDRVSNLPEESFAEPTTRQSQYVYEAEAMRFQQEVARIHRTPSGSVRAPGEAVGMIGLEVAMDMLAEKLGVDPVELRLRNMPQKHPISGKSFGARALEAALEDGARRFGWSERKAVGTTREGDWLIGVGMASAVRPNMLIDASARVRLSPSGAVVETDMTDIGTGSYTIFAQIAGEMLGMPTERVEVRLGDTRFPPASGSGGSFGASSTGSAVFLASRRIREKIAAKLGCTPEELSLQDGIARGDNREAPLADLIEGELDETAHISSGDTDETHFSSGYGAHFCEVAVHRWSGEVRVRRFVTSLGIGRVLNEKTARSQAIGGIVWGIGTALHEALEHDPRTGHLVTRDLANYHVAAHADVPREIDVKFLEERDDHANPMQSKGIGELGISGAGAAVLNAIHNACGARVLHLPATPDKVIAELERADRT